MRTIIFIEIENNSVGIRLDKKNIKHDYGNKKLRVARFINCFNPEKNLGYYSETYLKLLIHKWKFYKNMKKNILYKLLPSIFTQFPIEIINNIINYY